MLYFLTLVALVGGMITQLVLALWGKLTRKDVHAIWWCFALPVFFSVIALLEDFSVANIRTVLLVSFGVWFLSMVFAFKKQLIPVVTELMMVTMGVCFNFLAFSTYGANDWTFVAGIITTTLLIVAVFPVKLPSWAKGLMYLWYACMAAGVAMLLLPEAFWQTLVSSVDPRASHPGLTELMPLHAYVAGISLAYAMTLLWFVFDILTVSPAIQGIGRASAHRFLTDHQFDPVIMMGAIAVGVGLLLGNRYFLIVDQSFVIAIIIGVSVLWGTAYARMPGRKQ